ncbi:MAG: nucleotidyl transferase AbiEii/AbiGii toxin family protein [Paenibacillaceae bacterium]
MNLVGLIKNTKTPFSLDFGVGDIVIPAPIIRLLPVLLSGFEKPEILTYSLESVIAEKFDAILSRMNHTSRMKNFYDIYYLASTVDFEGRSLQEALFETLQNRGTPYERNSLELVALLSSDIDMMHRWNTFCRKVIKQELDFNDVLSVIVNLLELPFGAILNESEFFGKWNAEGKKYK